MDQIQIESLANGVEGCHIQTAQFKTSRISINLFLPIQETDVCANALLAGLLTRASADYPDFTHLNQRLNELYGATLFGDVMKFGDMQIVKFVINVLDDCYTLGGEKISQDAAELLLSMIFTPPLQNGLFSEQDFESEKRLLIEQINGEINDKRRYAITKTESALYQGEPSGISRYGDIKDAENLTNTQAVAAWKAMLQNAFVRVNIVSSTAPDAVYQKIKEYFAPLNRNVQKIDVTKKHAGRQDVLKLEEHMNVTQAKLCMAFAVSGMDDAKDKDAVRVMTDMFGGGPYSKLFANVREKQSLCYYCAARPNFQKATILVDSGILEENRQKAIDGILQQLKEMQNGNFSEDDLAASKMALTDSARTVCDSPADLDTWYALRIFENDPGIETFIGRINGVSKEDVQRAANAVTLDTVYFLGTNGNEGGANQ